MGGSVRWGGGDEGCGGVSDVALQAEGALIGRRARMLRVCSTLHRTPRPALRPLPLGAVWQVRVLSEFGSYATTAVLLREGGSALLPRRMSALLAPVLARLRGPGGGGVGVSGVARPDLLTAGPEEWNHMVVCILLGAAGLAKYLMDSFPDDEEFDRLAQWLW